MRSAATHAHLSRFVDETQQLKGCEVPVSGLAWSPDGFWLTAAGSDGMIYQWDAKLLYLRSTLHVPNVTNLAWSPDCRHIAATTASGSVLVLDGQTLDEVDRFSILDDGTTRPLLCVLWSPTGDYLVIGGQDTQVYLRQWEGYTARESPQIKALIGHTSPVRALAWAHRREPADPGKPLPHILASGTTLGNIGLWELGQWDEISETGTLRHWLRHEEAGQYWSHKKEVTDLAWGGNYLASSSLDGTMRLWNVTGQLAGPQQSHRLVLNKSEGKPLGVGFAPNGQVLVLRTDRHLSFSSFNQEGDCLRIYDHLCPARPKSNAFAIHSSTGTIAIDDAITGTIRLITVDFSSLLRHAPIHQTSYRSAKVVLFGAKGSGKTQVAKALSIENPELPSATYGDPAVKQIYQRSEQGEIVEMYVADLEGDSQGVLMRQLELSKGSVPVLVVEANSLRVRLSSNRDPIFGSAGPHASVEDTTESNQAEQIVAVTKFDALSDSAATDLEAALRGRHGFKFFVFGKTGEDCSSGLKDALLATVNWADAPSLDSIYTFYNFCAFMRRSCGNLALVSKRHLAWLFAAANPHLSGLPEDTMARHFDSCLELAENRGLVRVLGGGRHVLLQPSYLRSYVAAFATAAEDDKTKLGRVTLGPKSNAAFPITAHSSEERVLLSAVLDEIRDRKLAFEVSTSDAPCLVFPQQSLEALEQPESKGVLGRFEYATQGENMFSSLVVKLAALTPLVGQPKLYQNGVVFELQDGSKWGMATGDVNNTRTWVDVFSDRELSQSKRVEIRNIVETYLSGICYHEPVSWTPNGHCQGGILSPAGTTAEQRNAGVLFCYDERDLRARSNVAEICAQLNANGISTWYADGNTKAGQHRQIARDTAFEQYRVVAFAVSSSRLTMALRDEYLRARDRGRHVIPVILPGMPDTAELPAELTQVGRVDFRELSSRPLERLAEGVRLGCLEELPITRASESQFIFLSYYREDEGLVDTYRRRLEHRGFSVRWDRTIGKGTNWKEAINYDLIHADATLLFLSRDSTSRARSVVHEEIRTAVEIQRRVGPNGVYLIPVRLDDCEVLNFRIDANWSVRDLQSVDLFGANADEQFEMLVEALIEARRQRRRDSFG